MLNALRLSLPTRRPAALLALLLCTGVAGGPLAAPVLAQGSLVAPPQTKEEAKEAREAAEKANKDEGAGISVEAALALTGLLLLGGAIVYMVRDSSASVIADERLPPGVSRSTARGAPKNMFEGESKPGGQVGKTKKRAKAKRQKQARRANRPR